METVFETVRKVNNAICESLWSGAGLIPLFATGVVFTVLLRGFQVRRFGHILKVTVGSLFGGERGGGDSAGISRFQAMCTALAACVGVGNIAGVSTAVALGGPGAVFWMWVASFFGMMTAYAENVLGILYRRKGPDGRWQAGPMYYLRDGFGARRGCGRPGRVLAAMFALFCVLASFGMGNMSQVNTATVNLTQAFPLRALSQTEVCGTDIYSVMIGLVLMVIEGALIIGGVQRIARFTGRVVPFMVVLYTVGALIVIICHYENILPALSAIFRCAFTPASAGAGAVGFSAKTAMEWGVRRGVFSNEAGLGSSVMVNGSSDAKSAPEQGMWAIFEVFIDTIVMCTLTALVLLTSGLVDLKSGALLTDSRSTVLVAEAFSGVFGRAGGGFIAVSVLLFAFSTVLGWSCYGLSAWEYLFGQKSGKVYKVLYIPAVFLGATASLELVWELSDTFNALMMLPNLVGVLSLAGVVVRATRRYLRTQTVDFSRNV